MASSKARKMIHFSTTQTKPCVFHPHKNIVGEALRTARQSTRHGIALARE